MRDDTTPLEPTSLRGLVCCHMLASRDAGDISRLHWLATTTGREGSLLPTGQELVWLAEALPERQICGIDLAEGMVDVARRRLQAAGLGCGKPCDRGKPERKL